MPHTLKPHFLRNTFLTGFVILIPIFVTYILISFLFNQLSGVGAPVLRGLSHILGYERLAWVEPLAPMVNLFLSLAVIFLLGLVGTNIVGRRILSGLNTLLLRLPLVSSVYGAAKQVVETFHGPGQSFQRVVLLQFPNKGCWMMGLVASERPDSLNLTSSGKMLSVFIPTTPNPTSGFLAQVSPSDVLELNYDVEDAFKFIVSAGIVGKNFSRAEDEATSRAALSLNSSET